MSSLYARRGFVYQDDILTIKQYLLDQGYRLQDRLHPSTQEPIACDIDGTTISIGYQMYFSDGKISPGQPMITLLNTPEKVHNDEDYAMRSIQLYEQLYRKFRKKKAKA